MSNVILWNIELLDNDNDKFEEGNNNTIEFFRTFRTSILVIIGYFMSLTDFDNM